MVLRSAYHSPGGLRRARGRGTAWKDGDYIPKMRRSHAKLLGLVLLLAPLSPVYSDVGVRAPMLVDPDPWGVMSSPPTVLYQAPSSPRLIPSMRRGFLAWRYFYADYPVSLQSAGPLDALTSRVMDLSLTDRWLAVNRANALRETGERGSLVPTIYLPLDMPPILAGAIGEGGQIDISGYQKISLSGVTHYRPNQVEQEGQSQSLFPDLKMEQELRVQLEGTIGEKIHVDVDHDSERSLGPQSSVSLRYEGYEDEIIQSIEMGDVSLSITGPEFVSYSIPSQGLFGAKVLAQVGPVELTTIASRETGSSETSEFVGQATMVEDTLLDIYPADNYFFLTFPDSVEQPEIVDIRVFQDDGDGTNNEETGAVFAEYFVPTSPSDTTYGSGWWDELLPGQELDFVLVDSTIIRFNGPINDNYTLAVWMVTAQGDTLGSVGDDWSLKLIKESNPLPSYPTWDYELRNRYFLGANNIVQESFICNIYLSRPGEEPVQTQGGVPFIELMGLDTNGDGSLTDEEGAVDWDNGFLVFPDVRPFDSDVLEERNPAIYDERDPLPTQSLYFIETSYRAASTTYSLGQLGIIPGSETVTLTVAGVTRTLVRDQDYTIIYEVGVLTLMGEAAEDAQDPNSSLRVTFEYMPLFASQTKTLVGTRAVYGIGADSWVGATAMFENASTPGERPRVGEESTRTLVTDVDMHLEAKPEFLTDLANLVPGINTEARSRAVLSGEVAMSFPNPNVDGEAYIDDMEGTESSLPMGQSRPAWHRPSIPHLASPYLFPPGELRWYNTYRRWRLGDIVPGVSGDRAEDWENSVLELYFEPEEGNPASWGGIMRCIDKYGLDLSKKTHLRLYVRATGSALDGNLWLDLGERIDEDSYWLERVAGELVLRSNGTLDTEDVNRDGILANDEDTGLDNLFDDREDPGSSEPDPNMDNYEYSNSLPPSERYLKVNGTQGNNALDTEDLNSNGSLDRSNSFFRIRIPLDDPEYVVSGPNADGWMLVEVPLTDTSLVSVPGFVTGTPTWEKVSYARLWVDGMTTADTIQVYDFAVVGNRWESRGVELSDSVGVPVTETEQFNVSTVNNRENPAYASDPPPGVDPGEDEYGEPRLEQALSLQAVDMAAGHRGRAVQSFYREEDYTAYSEMRFLVHGDGSGSGAELFYRLGRDSLNYYQVSVPLSRGWQVVSVDLSDLVDLKREMQEAGLDRIESGDLAVRGSPNLAAVMQLTLGVVNRSSSRLSTTVWVNDITLHEPYSQTGVAHRVTAGVDLADLLYLDGDYRQVDADFHGLGSRQGQGRTSTTYSGSSTLNLDRFTPPLWSLSAPATFSWSRTVSRPRFQTGSDYRLDEEASWEQRSDATTWATGFQLRKNGRSDNLLVRYLVDPFQMTHTYQRSLGRTYTSTDTTHSASGQLSYDLSLGTMKLLSLPVIDYLRLRPTGISWSVRRNNGLDTRWSSAGDDTVQTRATTTRTLSSTGSVSVNPWQGLTGSASLGVTRDLLYPRDALDGLNVGREIGRNQSVTVSQEIDLFQYLRPRFSYDARYAHSRLAPHTGSGADSLGRPRFSVTSTRRVSVNVGLTHALRSLARLRDERLDEEREPGSPGWILMKLERWANLINDPTVTFYTTEASEYRDMGYLPGLAYRLGLEPVLDDETAWDRTRGRNLSVSGGIRPVTGMSVRTEYSFSETRSLYTGFWNRQRSETWPKVTFSWSGLDRLPGLDELLATGVVSTGYSLETNETGRFEEEEFTPTSETSSARWSPLLNVSVTLENDVQLSFSDNLTLSTSKNFTGTQAETRSRSSSAQFKVQYAFSAPGGIAIPLPLLNRLRISFQSDLTTSLTVSRNRTFSELVGSGLGSQLQTDREEWRIEPALNYDFGTVVAGLTGIFGWKTDRVNSQYDQRDTGLNIWVTINF